MKPNQNFKSITSVVVILLSLPAHLDYSSKERKAQKDSPKAEIVIYIRNGSSTCLGSMRVGKK